jgi:hypothetical protein
MPEKRVRKYLGVGSFEAIGHDHSAGIIKVMFKFELDRIDPRTERKTPIQGTLLQVQMML